MLLTREIFQTVTPGYPTYKINYRHSSYDAVINLDEFDFNTAFNYVQFAINNLDTIKDWERYTGLDFNLYDIIVAYYLDIILDGNASVESIKEISKIIQITMGKCKNE